ncbi:MAG: response regulator [Proteobacteria bacterium]|nr:response regulator [Pseudomonadota bacterium]
MSKISCLATKALIDYVRINSPENLHLLWASLKGEVPKEEDPEHFLSNPQNNISIDVCRDVMEQARKATSDDMTVYKAALGHGKQIEVNSIRRRLLRPFFGPKRAIQKVQEIHDKLFAGNRIEIVSVSNTHSLVRLHWSKNLPLSQDFCMFAKGMYQAMPTMFHLPPARLWERVCYFKGGPYCEYEMWWDKRPLKAPHPRPVLKRGFFRPPEGQGVRNENHISVQDQGAEGLHEEPLRKPPEMRAAAGDDAQGKSTDPTPGNIFHEFDNLFAGINERLSLMLTDIDSSHPYFEHLMGIEGKIQQWANLTKRLLDVPRNSKDPTRVTSVNQNGVSREKGVSRELFRGTETVLLVDNEDMLIDVCQQMVQAMGYKVLVARTCEEAIEIYRNNRDDIDMVILDMNMADMTGGKTYDRLRKINPNIKVLIASGYCMDEEARQALSRGCNDFIQKPFSMKQLSEKMRVILDSPPHPSP